MDDIQKVFEDLLAEVGAHQLLKDFGTVLQRVDGGVPHNVGVILENLAEWEW